MDIRHQRYMVALAEEGSITKASKRLGISQPALTKWLNSTESQLGIQLLLRSRKQLILTPAGKVYLEASKEIIKVRQNTYSKISGITENFKETIYIGGTPQRGSSMIANIFADFQAKYPMVSLKIIESYNKPLIEILSESKIDFFFCSTWDMEHPDVDYIHTADEEILLMVPENHPLAYDASKLNRTSEFPSIDLKKFADTPFIMLGEDTSAYIGITQLFNKVGINPNVIFQTNNVASIYKMISNGCGAAFIPRYYFSPLDGVCAFSLKPKLIHHLGVALKKGHILTDAQRYLINLVLQNTRQAPVFNINENINNL